MQKPWLNKIVEKIGLVQKIDSSCKQADVINDPWFDSHYGYAANVVCSVLGKAISFDQCKLLDVGCGDGITTLGVSEATAGDVHGIDLTDAFKLLGEKARSTIGLRELPQTLHFHKIEEHRPFPFDAGFFDGGYSWSVFEHISDIPTVLAEVRRVLKDKGVFFLQIEPLFYSPFGSHLRRLIDIPWAHLLLDDDSYFRLVGVAQDTVAVEERDLLYQTNEFAFVKEYLIEEYKKLNRLTVDQLLDYVTKSGFRIVEKNIQKISNIPVPEYLIGKYPEKELLINEVQCLLAKV